MGKGSLRWGRAKRVIPYCLRICSRWDGAARLSSLSLGVTVITPAVGVLFWFWVFFWPFTADPRHKPEPQRQNTPTEVVLVLFLGEIEFKKGWGSTQLRTQHL
jgi:hypothetical protein